RRSHAQLLRELRRVGERQLRSNPGLVTADTQLQGRRTRNARGGRRAGERSSRRGGPGVREWRCWIRRYHTLRVVLCRGERGAPRLELRLSGVRRSSVPGEALEAVPLSAPQRLGIEIGEPSAGVVRETEQGVSIEVESRLAYQLPRDRLRLQSAEVDGELGV